MILSAATGQASAAVIALWFAFGFVAGRYSNSVSLEKDESSEYADAIKSIAGVLERRPECVCNVKTEAVVVECSGPQIQPVTREQIVSDYLSWLVIGGLLCFVIGLWLGLSFGSRKRERTFELSGGGPIPLDVDRLTAARQRARQISN